MSYDQTWHEDYDGDESKCPECGRDAVTCDEAGGCADLDDHDQRLDLLRDTRRA